MDEREWLAKLEAIFALAFGLPLLAEVLGGIISGLIWLARKTRNRQGARR